jgi:non-specific serine/threonine protein kinase
VTEGLCERTGGELFPYQQQRTAAAAAACETGIGLERFRSCRDAGRAVGRADGIAEALWPTSSSPVESEDSGGDDIHSRSLPLSRRELEVAELIAEGLTNRHIAQRLFIAERTVDTHVGHILTKLHCTTRAQVAALVARHRPRESQ